MLCKKCIAYEPCDRLEPAPCDICGELLVPEGRDLLSDSPTTIVKEVRTAQLHMTRTIEDAFIENKHVLAQAGVGTGKSLAYLIPTLSHHVATKRNVVISTATLGLQSQLIKKDIPDLLKTYEGFGFKDINVKLRKSSSHYVCAKAVESVCSDVYTRSTLPIHFIKWAKDAGDGRNNGDSADYQGRLPSTWSQVNAEDCLGSGCSLWRTCSFAQLRNNKKDQPTVYITNHATVGLDMSISSMVRPNPILGEHAILILDEAHKALGFFRNAFSDQLTLSAIKKLVETTENVCGYSNRSNVLKWAGVLFAALPKPAHKDNIQLTHTMYAANLDGKVLDLISALKESSTTAAAQLYGLSSKPTNLVSYNMNAGDHNLFIKLSRLKRRYIRTIAALDDLRMLNEESIASRSVYLSNTDKESTLNLIPNDISSLIHETLFNNTDLLKSVVLTSATLKIGGSFDYILKEFGLTNHTDKIKQIDVPSPFDYDNHAALYIPKCIPAPPAFNSNPATRFAYTKAIAEEVRSICNTTLGRAFVLFSSRVDLEAVKDYLIVSSGFMWPLIVQTEGLSVSDLLRTYATLCKSGKGPVLLGLKSFYEGVSIEGDDLSAVIISKLPFPPMSDMSYKVRCQLEGDKAFTNVTIPEMIKDIQQATGRLIRTATDTGIVAILDSRIHTKPYGITVLKSLPFNKRTHDFNKIDTWYKNVRDLSK